jgi:hypothetical protein
MTQKYKGFLIEPFTPGLWSVRFPGVGPLMIRSSVAAIKREINITVQRNPMRRNDPTQQNQTS